MASDDPIIQYLKQIEKDLNRAIGERRDIEKTVRRWKMTWYLVVTVLLVLLVLA